MARPRVLVVGLDGLEITVAERLMAAGTMPALAELRRRAACFRLDHGPAQRTGLAWEHVASGLSPEAGCRSRDSICRRHWPRMPAFALPSFYDGRIRLNLRGRGKPGVIEPSGYEEACRAIERILRECRNPRTGEPAVEAIERADTSIPAWG